MTEATEKTWRGPFGNAYIERNPQTLIEMETLHKMQYGESRSEINREFLDKFNPSLRILEVGCNVGNQLVCLRKTGFKNLCGIEINQRAVKLAQARNLKVIWGSGLDLPFCSQSFDLIFTSYFLIHIAPSDITKVMTEIHRCSREYIWGFEYCAENYTPVQYRGRKDLLWKADFSKFYLSLFKDLELVQERKLPYLINDNVDKMFLLRKRKCGE